MWLELVVPLILKPLGWALKKALKPEPLVWVKNTRDKVVEGFSVGKTFR
jgi:hypothetical protein